MPNKVTDKHKLNLIELMRNDMGTNTSPHFVFMGRHIPFRNEAGANIDSIPPEVQTSVDGINYDIYRNMICAKYVTDADTAPMVKYQTWESGVVYDRYDHLDVNLANKPWYVVVKRGTNRDVFVCLGNNGGRPSTVAPSFHDSTPIESGGYETQPDGYRWKYMYTVPQDAYNKFATSTYLPVIPNAAVTGNSVAGSIDYVNVEYGGSSYASYTSGTIVESRVGGVSTLFTISSSAASNSDFYNGCAVTIVSGPGVGQIRKIVDYVATGDIKRIYVDREFDTVPTTMSGYEISPLVVLTGDGEDFEGRALVNASSSNSIYKVEVINRGVNYTWASATVSGNTGGTTNFATLKPIISPYAGHGANVAKELHSTALGISTKFNSGESLDKVFDTNEFRTVGLIRGPRFANVQLTIATNDGFAIGDNVVQPTTGASGTLTSMTQTTLTLTNVLGYFRTGYNVIATSAIAPNTTCSAVVGQSTYADQTIKLNVTGMAGSYEEDENITQHINASTEYANGVLYTSNSSVLHLTNVYGTFGPNIGLNGSLTIDGSTSQAVSTIVNTTPGDFVIGSGDVLYIDNKTPVAKATDQSETIKIILEF